MTLKDFKSYAEIHKIADNDYRNKDIFVRDVYKYMLIRKLIQIGLIFYM